MDTPTLVWIIIGIIVVAIIIVVAVMLSRRNSAKRLEAQHAKAQELRSDARETEVAAREREAQAAQACADSTTATAEAEQAKARAAQAGIDAERAAAKIDDHQSDAAALRAEQADTLRKADEVDPAVSTTASDRTRREDREGSHDRRLTRDSHDGLVDDRDAVHAVHADSDLDRDEPDPRTTTRGPV